jgi:hypothetical protein
MSAFALAAATTAAIAAPAAAKSSDPTPDRTYAASAGDNYVVQNEAEKRRLEAQGFPQYSN